MINIERKKAPKTEAVTIKATFFFRAHSGVIQGGALPIGTLA